MIVPAIRTLLLAALLALPVAAANDATRNSDSPDVPTRHNEATVAQLQAEMASGRLSSEELTKEYADQLRGRSITEPMRSRNLAAIEQNRTGAAVACAAAVFGASELQILAQNIEQRAIGVCVYALWLPFDGEVDRDVHKRGLTKQISGERQVRFQQMVIFWTRARLLQNDNRMNI